MAISTIGVGAGAVPWLVPRSMARQGSHARPALPATVEADPIQELGKYAAAARTGNERAAPSAHPEARGARPRCADSNCDQGQT